MTTNNIQQNFAAAKCPHCGRRIIAEVILSKAGHNGGKNGLLKRFVRGSGKVLADAGGSVFNARSGSSLSAPKIKTKADFQATANPYGTATHAPPPVLYAERTEPARPASFESDVVVPFLQAVVTGSASLIVTIPTAIFFEAPWWASLVMSGSVVAITWGGLLGDHRKLMWHTEIVDNKPLKPTSTKRIELEVKHSKGSGRPDLQFVGLPDSVTDEMFYDWCKGVTIGGKSPARSHWVGSGKPFGRDQYDAYLSALETAGIVYLVPGKGRRLTPGGRRTVKILAKNR